MTTIKAACLGVIGCAAVWSGCASTLPAERVAAPRAAIRAAEEMGAYNVPRASLHLKLAKDQVAQADALIRDDEQERAAWVLTRADADAELALLLAREQRVLEEAAAVRNQIHELQQRTTPKS
ncbi:MAG: DUF4398 domain-containing protein [Polyangiaceae bacterium]|nr:DUF4398 domain-containing protein [Polyangiaceae bacterium]